MLSVSHCSGISSRFLHSPCCLCKIFGFHTAALCNTVVNVLFAEFASCLGTLLELKWVLAVDQHFPATLTFDDFARVYVHNTSLEERAQQ